MGACKSTAPRDFLNNLRARAMRYGATVVKLREKGPIQSADILGLSGGGLRVEQTGPREFRIGKVASPAPPEAPKPPAPIRAILPPRE